MSLKNAIIGFILNLLASGGWQYLSDEKVNPIIVGSAIIWVFLLLNYGREDSTDSFLTKLWRKLVPRRTFQFIPYTTRWGFENFWTYEMFDDEYVMQIQGEWHVTNLTDESIRILRAYLVKPSVEGWVCTYDRNADAFGAYSISPGRVTRVKVTLKIHPHFCEEGRDYKGKIVFIDQFNNKHKIKATFEFRSKEW